MKALLNNSVRPRLGASQSVLQNGSGTSLRNIRGSQLRSKLTFCDAFTILLAPVLTAAFVADITIKDRRRRSWDQKIAQIEQEIDELKGKTLQSWNTFPFRSVQAGLPGQRRGYSTAATAARANDKGDSLDSFDYTGVDAVRSAEVTGQPSVDLERFENLLATKVGLQMLVYIYTGRDPSGKYTKGRDLDSDLAPSSMSALIEHLAYVNRGLYELKTALSTHPGMTFEPVADHQLDTEISSLTWRCRTGNISTEELIFGYTKALLQSRTGLSLNTYQNLVETFSTLKADPFTFIAMMPYLNTNQVLSDRNVGNIIQAYGNLKDSRRLRNFLGKLLDDKRVFRTATSWKSVDVNGIRVAVPENRRPRILDILIRAALQVDQPHKARAWATVLLEGDVTSGRMASLFNNFLTYCARDVDWTAGRLWLERAVASTALFAQDSPWMLERIVFRMMDLCMSCEQDEYYNNILNAAVLAGLSPPPTDESRPPSFSDQATIIRADWTSRIAEAQHDSRKVVGAVNAATTFQTEVGKVHFAIQNCIGVTDIGKLKSLLSSQEASSDNVAPRTSSVASSGTADVLAFNPFNSLSTAAGSVNEREPVSQTKQPASLQTAYNNLRQQYDDQVERDTWLQKLIVTGSLSDWQASGHGGLEEFAQRLIKVQGQRAAYQKIISTHHQELEDLKSQNTHLIAELEVRDKTEHELITAADELRSQLKAIKPKSLEAVFVEKENMNLRSDLQLLSERYLTALKEKEASLREMENIRHEREAVQQEMTAFQERRARLDEKRLADLHLLHQDNENLRLQIQAAEKRLADLPLLRQDNKDLRLQAQTAENNYQQLLLLKKAQDGNFRGLLNSKDARVDELRAERAKLAAANEKMSSILYGRQDSPNPVEQDFLASEEDKHRFTIRRRPPKVGSKGSVTDSSHSSLDSSLSFSSS